MRTTDRRRGDEQPQSPDHIAAPRAAGDPRAPLTSQNLIALQRSVGNHAVARAIADAAAQAPVRAVARARTGRPSTWDRIKAIPGALKYHFDQWRQKRNRPRDEARMARLRGIAQSPGSDPRTVERANEELRRLKGKQAAVDSEGALYMRDTSADEDLFRELSPRVRQREEQQRHEKHFVTTYRPDAWETGDDEIEPPQSHTDIDDDVPDLFEDNADDAPRLSGDNAAGDAAA